MYRRQIYFKKLAYATVKIGKFRIVRRSCRMDTPGRANVAVKSEGHLLKEFLLAQEGQTLS